MFACVHSSAFWSPRVHSGSLGFTRKSTGTIGFVIFARLWVIGYIPIRVGLLPRAMGPSGSFGFERLILSRYGVVGLIRVGVG